MLLAYCGVYVESSAGKSSPAVLPNVRAKRATTAWRAGQQAQKWAAGPALDGLRDMPLALRLSEGLGGAVHGAKALPAHRATLPEYDEYTVEY